MIYSNCLTIFSLLFLSVGGCELDDNNYNYDNNNYLNCISRNTLKCYNDDVYWFDSCGEREYWEKNCSFGCSKGSCNSWFDCALECPDHWISDGMCDSNCDVVACNYDGIDCQTASVTLGISDGCIDGEDIWYRFYLNGGTWFWPNSVFIDYWTSTSDDLSTHKLNCRPGALLCFGAKNESGTISWGVGFDGDRSCDSCCWTCDEGTSYNWDLICN